MLVCTRLVHTYSEDIMKRLLSLIVLLIVVIVTVDKLPNVTVKKLPKSQPTPVEQFMHRVALIESGGNYRVTNEFGMMGKYQFSPSTVRVLGFRVTQKQFLSDPKIQDSVMFAYMKANHDELSYYIKKYNGKMFNGVKVTRAGILAGAHFAGTTGVVAYFKNGGSGIVDARGTSLKQYMAYFSNFNLPEI